MSDRIQELLNRAYHEGDRRALSLAFFELKKDWAPAVARFLRAPPTSSGVEQVLGDILIEVLLVTGDKPPRALAPADHPNPAAYRRRVLLSALIDKRRRHGAYEKAVKTHATLEPLTDHQDTPQVTEEQIALRQMRDRVVARLPELEIWRRFALLLELGVQAPPYWVEELARLRGRSSVELMERLRAYECAPADEQLKLSVLYDEPSSDAREAFRKTLSRARDEMAELIKRERS